MDLVHIEKVVVTIIDRRVLDVDADCEPAIVEHADPGYNPGHAGHRTVPVPADPYLLTRMAANVAARAYLGQCMTQRAWQVYDVRGFLLDRSGTIVAHATAAHSASAVEPELRHITATIERLHQQREAICQLSRGHVSDRQAAAAAGFSHTHVAKLRSAPAAPPALLTRLEEVLMNAGLPLAASIAAVSESGRPDDPYLLVRPHYDPTFVTLSGEPTPSDDGRLKTQRDLVERAVDVLEAHGYRLDPVNAEAQTRTGQIIDVPAWKIHLA